MVVMRQRMGKTDRLARRKDLDRVFRQGRRVSDALLTLHVIRNELGRSRMAVAVSVQHGPAVARVRIKRLCREGFRLQRGELPAGIDYVLKPRVGAELTLADVMESLRRLASKAERLLPPG